MTEEPPDVAASTYTGLHPDGRARRRWSRLVSGKLLPWVSTPIIVIVILAVWQLYVKAMDVSKFVLPPPSAVGKAFWQELSSSFVWNHAILPTVYHSVIGFAAAVVIGMVIGFIVGKYRTAFRVLNPFIVGSQVVPLIALVPLFILWFGFGPTAKVVTAAIIAFFPIVTNAAFGVRTIPLAMYESFASMKATPWQKIIHLEFPACLPHIFTGAKVSIVLATVGAIVAEFVGGNDGLGAFAVSAQNQLQIPELFGAVVIMTIIGFALYSVVELLNRWLVRWSPRE